ncbi:DNA repair and recombination protein RAD52 [Copidosoma floridanum]|uniref:DNA repair and recombination protein RAD52 n=1 Tax=Copidosoma floridanum TaxID=29053 RepID=UPI0006C9AC8F|nr:DNA repair and recombination protein RAD52 [Copidosoma floridanum]
MSCIKFPTSKSELKTPNNKDSPNDQTAILTQLIAAANHTFGPGNWSHAITSQTLDFVDYINGRYHTGCATILRVQLKNGEFHEAVGYHSSEGSTKSSAVQRVRFGSLNDGLKKALLCFDCDISSKINTSINRQTISPLATETPSSKVQQLKKATPVQTTTTTTAVTSIDEEAFAEIPMSQADAILDIVEMDHLFDKDQLANGSEPPQKEENKSFVPSDKEKKESSNVNTHRIKDVKSNKDGDEDKKKLVRTNSNTTTEVTAKASFDGVSKETKIERSRSNLHKVMTEEEMRLERKRKQREMQEEFKRKEMKKMYSENGHKLPNPRY